MSEVVLIEHDGPVRLVTLNRPDQMNAFDGDLHDVFVATLQLIGDDPDARAVVLTGAGQAFCAGAV